MEFMIGSNGKVVVDGRSLGLVQLIPADSVNPENPPLFNDYSIEAELENFQAVGDLTEVTDPSGFYFMETKEGKTYYAAVEEVAGATITLYHRAPFSCEPAKIRKGFRAKHTGFVFGLLQSTEARPGRACREYKIPIENVYEYAPAVAIQNPKAIFFEEASEVRFFAMSDSFYKNEGVAVKDSYDMLKEIDMSKLGHVQPEDVVRNSSGVAIAVRVNGRYLLADEVEDSLSFGFVTEKTDEEELSPLDNFLDALRFGKSLRESGQFKLGNYYIVYSAGDHQVKITKDWNNFSSHSDPSELGKYLISLKIVSPQLVMNALRGIK